MNINHNELVTKTARMVGKATVELLNIDSNGFSRCSTCVAITFAPLSSMAAVIMKDFDAKAGKFPTRDHNLIAALIIAEGSETTANGMAECEFSPQILSDALRSFETLTGRNGWDLIAPELAEQVKKFTNVDSNNFGSNSKFLPHD